MAIPEFNKRGSLDKGIHQCTLEEFINRFCYGKNTIRFKYRVVVEQLIAFSISRGGKSIIFGGSFITSEQEPNDLDCMLILPNKNCCMLQSKELLSIEGCELDVLVLAETNKETIYNFLNLFSKNKFDLDVGLIEIVIDCNNDKSTWDDYDEYSSIESLLKAREAYIYRQVIKGISEKKVFLTVVGWKQYLEFNHLITPIISSSGWIFAPFVYYGENVFDDYDKLKVWINYIYNVYDTKISVLADGIGTLLFGMYLKDKLNYAYFDKIVLSKSLLTTEFNWNEEFVKCRVNQICSLKSSKEINWDEKISKDIKKHNLYGESYKLGFANENEKIIEYPYSYNEIIDWEEFQNNIFPIFQLSNLIEKNLENDFLLKLNEINESDNLEMKEIFFNMLKNQ